MTHLCRFLRWKTGYGRLYSTEAELIDILARNEVPFRCLRTQHPWGPDDAATQPEQCAPGRRCYEPSEELARIRGSAQHAPEDDVG